MESIYMYTFLGVWGSEEHQSSHSREHRFLTGAAQENKPRTTAHHVYTQTPTMREGSTRSWPHQISRQYSDKEVANSQAECVGLSTVMFYCILVSMATTILVVQLTHCWGKLTFQNDASSAGLN